MPQGDETPLKRTPLHDLHVARGARMVPFAGYEMPVQYEDGILAEHRWTDRLAQVFLDAGVSASRLAGARSGTAAL